MLKNKPGSISPVESASNLFDYIETIELNTAEGFMVPPDRVLPW